MGFLFILIYCIFIFFVLELSITILKITGLDHKVARFQVVSMLTSTGFTTKESELILRHPIRRKIAVFLILFGVFSLAVFISTISNILAKSFEIPQMIGITTFFGLMLLIFKNKTINLKMTKRFHEDLEREFELHELPINEILFIKDTDFFTGVNIFNDSRFANKKAKEIFLPNEDIILLFIQRGVEKIRHERLQLIIQEGDILFVYGNRMTIENKFNYEIEKMKTLLECCKNLVVDKSHLKAGF
ncbi:TrkA C-terminal domain-containing protein [Paenibacillus sp. GP183]|uniref:TrkA C-terminal domain-containing protein n=1 Tax=Paenibacillus sp. GP183 TaxID=1882751 RepID=UPI00089B5E58|nr:TrkA C-terminal domain-containing protein [Paenibacillus sp. GP183]SEC09533.1 TrkA-C domain-containing protein [Paenibacillus sp. GP183]